MSVVFAFLTLNPVFQLNHIPPKLCRLQDVPLISCCKVTDVMPVNSTKYLVNDWIPVLPYGCVPGASFHA